MEHGHAFEGMSITEAIRLCARLGIPPTRTLFLATCPKRTPISPSKRKSPPTPEQITEAFRIGISAPDAARMLDVPLETIVASGHPFVERTEIRKWNTSPTFNLMHPIPNEGGR